MAQKGKSRMKNCRFEIQNSALKKIEIFFQLSLLAEQAGGPLE